MRQDGRREIPALHGAPSNPAGHLPHSGGSQSPRCPPIILQGRQLAGIATADLPLVGRCPAQDRGRDGHWLPKDALLQRLQLVDPGGMTLRPPPCQKSGVPEASKAEGLDSE